VRLTGIENIKVDNCRILYGEEALVHLQPYLEKHFDKGDSFYLLTDKNTHQFCLPLLEKYFSNIKAEYILPPGEATKDLEHVRNLWDWLMENNAGREDCLLNLGGGVVSDLGGFVASTYKRGIRYINIPTTLIAQTDAAVGGKTGINFNGVKNQLGSFYSPEAVFIDPVFLDTLEEDHLRTGFVEIVKCSLLSGERAWKSVTRTSWKEQQDWVNFIGMALKVKASLVRKDPYDMELRKALNFGHTLGHAFESLSMKKYPPGLLHGDAVALGMVGEVYLSWRKVGLCWDKTLEIARYLKRNFLLNPFHPGDTDEVLALITKDKKNKADEIRFSLLDDFGKAAINRSCEPAVVQKAMEFVFKEKV